MTFETELKVNRCARLRKQSLDRNSAFISLVSDASCELCGFDFENRKALASHARAHLRQLGIIEWKADGATSPIELLSELIRKDPVKVEAITRRYRMGDLYIKKVARAPKHTWRFPPILLKMADIPLLRFLSVSQVCCLALREQRARP